MKKRDASLLEASIILGPERIVNILDVTGKWNRQLKLDTELGYTIEQIESCAEANKNGLANWFLVYHQGKSPKEILAERFKSEFGFGAKNRFEKNLWFSHSNESFWVNKKEDAGYYLINFIGEKEEYRELRFESTIFAMQEKIIEKLPQKCRAPLGIVLEAVFSIYDSLGILLLEKWSHLSSTRSYDGSLIYLGATWSSENGEKMMNIFKFPKNHEDSVDDFHYYGIGTVLMMKKII
ncbi:MAG: hypothetical protein WC842_03250 [Candidatus Paceibacterota bacterium]|jgi:hypothetical protein